MAIHIVAISGSLRKGSFNTTALKAAQKLAPEGVTIDILENAIDLPIYNQDIDTADAPAGVAKLRAAIKAADALLIATPEYNYFIPGGLKNALDWASRPYGHSVLNEKPTAIFSSSPGAFGGVRGQAALRVALTSNNADVVNQPEVFIGAVHEKFDAEGNLTDEATAKFLSQLIANLVAKVKKA